MKGKKRAPTLKLKHKMLASKKPKFSITIVGDTSTMTPIERLFAGLDKVSMPEEFPSKNVSGFDAGEISFPLKSESDMSLGNQAKITQTSEATTAGLLGAEHVYLY